LKFRDKKDVQRLTTQHDETVVPAPKGRGQPSVMRTATKPFCIVEYNSNMGSIDKQDQMLQLYSIGRKTMKWYKKLTFHLLNMALLNSYILLQKSDGCSTFLKFQHDVAAKQLFHDADSPEAKKNEALCWLTEHHFLDTLKPTRTWTNQAISSMPCVLQERPTTSHEDALSIMSKQTKTFCSAMLPTMARGVALLELTFEVLEEVVIHGIFLPKYRGISIFLLLAVKGLKAME